MEYNGLYQGLRGGVMTSLRKSSNMFTIFGKYISSVFTDGGTIRNQDITRGYYLFCKTNNLYNSIKFAWLGEAGIKTRTSGINQYISKIYGLVTKDSTSIDAIQSTAATQPYLSGNIAPNERYCLKNPNGGSNYMTHPTISFGATDSWSVTTVLNWNYQGDTANPLNIVGGTTKIRIRSSGNDRIWVGGIYFGYDTKNLVGKTNIITVTYSNGTIKLYINGVYYGTESYSSAFDFQGLFYGTSGSGFYGKMSGVCIRNKELSSTEVALESNYLRTIYPEMASVQIGTQTWTTSNYEAVCTPQGNLIPEVQSAATWATAQTLYDTAYNAAVGDATVKTYAGVKAAAMWCHYNNDPANGAIYGKLYNWFAVKLLQMDIDYYNAANPATPWGWRVPTQADFTTLSTYLGGDSVSGGKMKLQGTTYWNSPNTGADNSSGFSAIGGGYRQNDATYAGLNSLIDFYGIDGMIRNTSGSASVSYPSIVNTNGRPLRLIKV